MCQLCHSIHAGQDATSFDFGGHQSYQIKSEKGQDALEVI